jgi:hypothetical protein
MTYDDEFSNVLERVNEILNDHNGVYLEKRLFTLLKKEFPDLTRTNFQSVLNKLSDEDYVMQRGLIRRLPSKKSEISKKEYNDRKQGKGASDTSRIPDKRDI